MYFDPRRTHYLWRNSMTVANTDNADLYTDTFDESCSVQQKLLGTPCQSSAMNLVAFTHISARNLDGAEKNSRKYICAGCAVLLLGKPRAQLFMTLALYIEQFI